MKTHTLSIVTGLLFLFSIVSAQNTLTIALEDYSSLVVSGRIDLELIPSESKEMTITSKNGHPDEVTVDLLAGELKINLKTRVGNNDEITIKLPYSKLIQIEANSGAVVNSARNFEAGDIQLLAATGGKIELAVEVNSITAKVTQISDIILYGKTVSQNVTVYTGGNYLAYDLNSEDTEITVSSGSQGKVTASRKISATANLKGFIGYIGDPAGVSVKTSLGGEIVSFKTKEDAENF